MKHYTIPYIDNRLGHLASVACGVPLFLKGKHSVSIKPILDIRELDSLMRGTPERVPMVIVGNSRRKVAEDLAAKGYHTILFDEPSFYGRRSWYDGKLRSVDNVKHLANLVSYTLKRNSTN